MIPLKGDKAISPGQRPGCCCSRDLRPERAKAIIRVWTAMLLPLQGANPNIHRPRALPWAGCLLAFQAVTSQKLYRTPIIKKLFRLLPLYLLRMWRFSSNWKMRKNWSRVVRRRNFALSNDGSNDFKEIRNAPHCAVEVRAEVGDTFIYLYYLLI